MKFLHSIKAFALLLTVSAATVFAFEGQVDMQMTTENGKTMPFTYQIKGSQLRIDMAMTDAKKGKSMTMSTIPHPETGETHVLMHENKMLIVVKNQDIQDVTAEKSKTTPAMTFKLTGRKEKIAGIDAEEMVGESEGKRTEIWVTKELGAFAMANQSSPFNRGKSAPQSWADFTKHGNMFPLRVIQREKEGAPEKFRFEAVKIQKVSVPDSTFVSPADYKRLPDMGEMMRGMMPGATTH